MPVYEVSEAILARGTDNIRTSCGGPDALLHHPMSGQPLADLSRARRRHGVALIRRSGILRQASADAQLTYAVGILVATANGFVAKSSLDAGLADPSIVQVARELLRKAAA